MGVNGEGGRRGESVMGLGDVWYWGRRCGLGRRNGGTLRRSNDDK